ncbi:pro-sigmaK processing inhibitor BofA family protein [Ruminococcaceae bacterium OttesenSCG-928-L11]|nr:pro-sigmaK processing inhibitor BofA family protein [Ruminococcaceae bacterium OttesenSCG-928-L11]
MTPISALWLALFLIGALLFLFYSRLERFFRCFLFTAFTGIGALGIVWLAGRFIAIPLTITPLSLAASGILGIPGVVTMLIFHLI